MSYYPALSVSSNVAFYPAAQPAIDGGGTVSPGQFAGLQAWYDFSDDSYLTLSGTAITQALDRSGNGNHTDVQATGTKRPAVDTTNTSNGLQTASFDGGDTLVLPSALYTIANGANTQFVVSRTTVNNTEQRLVSFTEAGSMRCGIEYVVATTSATYYNRTSYAGIANTNVTTKSDYNLLRGQYNGGTTLSLAVNGGTAATNANGQTENGVDAGHIGSNVDTSRYLTGNIAEIIIYNRALSSSEITQVEIYLANKYGIYHPNAGWIGAYTTLQQALIHAWKLNKDNSFTATAGNPFALILDAQASALGAVSSWTDYSGRSNNAVQATGTQQPVNTANAIGGKYGLLFDGADDLLNAGSDASIDNIFAAGGTYIGVINPTSDGEGNAGRLFRKANSFMLTAGDTGTNVKIQYLQDFDGTDGTWILTNADLTIGGANIIAMTYSSADVTNDPVLYVNSLTAKAVTETSTPVGTAVSDAAGDLIISNNSGGDRTFDGFQGVLILVPSTATTAQLTSIYNSLATIYGVTLT